MLLKRFVCVSAIALCASATGMTASAMAASLQGAGSTLVAPLETEWAHAFETATGDTVQYGAVGSGTGITDISKGLVDFGASDAPMSSSQLAGCNNCLTVPWALSATGIGYNIPGIGNGLKLTGQVLEQIYSGSIKTWNNTAIKNLNKGLRLPSTTITPFYRLDGSGDTYAFTRYLSDISSRWASTVGFGTSVGGWPAGLGASKNSGVAAAVSSTAGAIGYISGSYLISAHIDTAQIRNNAGRFEYPNPNSIGNAAGTVHSVPTGSASNAGITIVDPPASQKIAYPISTFTYAIVPQNPSRNGQLLKSWLRFCVTTGRQFGYTLDFQAIPKVVQQAAETDIGDIS